MLEQIGELFLSALIGQLFDQFVSPYVLEFASRVGVAGSLENWKKTLNRIQLVLEDAEEKQHADRAVKQWLDDLRDLAYDVDDVLDELNTEALIAENQRSPSKFRKLIHGCVARFMPSDIKTNIKEITDRFNDLMTRKGDLNLRESVDGKSYRTRGIPSPTSVVTEAHVFGRGQDKEAVIKLLLSDESSHAHPSVIPILGMGGMGKTTLAQLVYNDAKVEKHFDLKAWACVSEDFDAVRVTKTILESLVSENCDGKGLNWLQEKLKEKLKGKKFLVILDDLWNEKYSDWTILRAPFEVGTPGSTIVITTRNQGVTSKTGTIPAYPLKELSNGVCLSILAYHALGQRDFSQHPNLINIGEEIARKCKGSPLAAKVLGGVLRSNEVDYNEWEDVLRNKIWDIPEVESEISPALMLSYYHLPSHLKRCFAYCSILPKDYKFREEELILLWMAEGFIQPPKGGKLMEELGRDYFRMLLSRSFFQQSSQVGSWYLMHDLINDLAQQVAGDICFKMEDRVGDNNGKEPSRNTRHLSYLVGEYDGIKKFMAFFELKYLRTFLPFRHPSAKCYLSRDVSLKLLPKLRRLRVLSLKGYCIYELPESIDDLKCLRFLDVSATKITSLPESVATLYNLQTLILEDCYSLKKLPLRFGNLVNLRHLNILGANALEGMPLEIGKLTSLRSLSNLVVGKGNFSGVKELGPLSHLQGRLCISRLENVINPMDARLIGKHKICKLSLEWSGNLDESQDRTSELEVLQMLQPHENLKDLTIKNYGGAEFPTWLSGPSLRNMVVLSIGKCKNCTSLPTVGQLPSLKTLFIKGMHSVKNVGPEFYGEGCSQSFRSLETLRFENMEEWENWIPCGEFPKLRELSIVSCPKLVGKLPNHLPLLESIVIDRCAQLLVSVSIFPEHCKLNIEGSKGVVSSRNTFDFSTLRFSSLTSISEFAHRIEGFVMDRPTKVEDLTIEHCMELTSLCSNDVELLQHFQCLGALRIDNCSKLVSLVAKEVEEQFELGFPSKLREIRIENCPVLEYLPRAMLYNNTYLEDISIRNCDSLMYFQTGQLPATLKRLTIHNCQKMVILVDGDDIHDCNSNTPLLEHLTINNCSSLKSLTSSGELPATLRQLEIRHCWQLESIAESFQYNSCLEIIRISVCGSLKSLPMGIHSLSHLHEILIQYCPTFDSFPGGGLLPTNLRELTIRCCEKMQALPNNITSLEIIRMTWSSIEASFEWGLCKLTSLKQLVISGDSSHLVSFPEMILPASLTKLSINGFPNLEHLSSKGFQNLNYLEDLSIKSCKKLMSFPEDGLPPSLRSLYINDCEKLTSFPKDGLPPSLLQLHIYNCPLLKEIYKKDEGPEWFKIAHIPYVTIDWKFIDAPEGESQRIPVCLEAKQASRKKSKG